MKNFKFKRMNLISDEVFSKIKSVDDLLDKINTTVNGEHTFEIVDKDDFLNRLKSFKSYLKKDLQDFTIDEVLKYYQNTMLLRSIFNWYDLPNFMRVIEYEQRNGL